MASTSTLRSRRCSTTAPLADTGETAQRLLALLPGARRVSRVDLAALRGVKGAYGLFIVLPVPIVVDAGRQTRQLSAGRYVYAGSAKGPGGLGARLARHFRADKVRRWHIDQLSCHAPPEEAMVIVDGSECNIVRQLVASGRFAVPVAGFGSSDCRHCPAHLLVEIEC